jgi:hypothetical protein
VHKALKQIHTNYGGTDENSGEREMGIKKMGREQGE